MSSSLEEKKRVMELIDALRFQHGLRDDTPWDECLQMFKGMTEVGRDLINKCRISLVVQSPKRRQPKHLLIESLVLSKTEIDASNISAKRSVVTKLNKGVKDPILPMTIKGTINVRFNPA